MKVIIKEKYNWEEKPHKRCKLGSFKVWEERTCSIEEFDERFGDIEGLWESKGKNHTEIICKDKDCYHLEDREFHKHCRRQVEDKKFYYIDFKSLVELKKFIEEVGSAEIFIEGEEGVGLVLEITN